MNAKRQTKIEWLLAHQQLWEGYPRPKNFEQDREITAALLAAGLTGPGTSCHVAGLISAARKQRRNAAARVSGPAKLQLRTQLRPGGGYGG